MLQKSIAISATTAYTVSVMVNLITSCLLHHILHTGAGLNFYITISERSSGSCSSGQYRTGVFILNIQLFTGSFKSLVCIKLNYLKFYFFIIPKNSKMIILPVLEALILKLKIGFANDLLPTYTVHACWLKFTEQIFVHN